MRDKSGGWAAKTRLIVAIGAIGTCLAGCGQSGGLTDVSKPVLAIDPADPCRQDREEFAKSKSYFTDQIVANVGGGALAGAATGALSSFALGANPVKGALIGAGVGAAAGGVVSYSNIMAQKHTDQAELSKSINDDLTKEGNEIDHTKASFARLRSCRFQQATFIKTQVRGRKMDRQIALQQLNQQKTYFAEEIDLAKQYKLSMDKRGDQFREAADTIKDQQIADVNQATQAQAAKRAADVSVPDKRNDFGNQIKSAETNSEIAFNLDSSKKVTSLGMAPDA
jgi:hypothetical protein